MAPEGILPKDFEVQSRRRFAGITNPEVPFEQFLDTESREFLRVQQLELDPKGIYNPMPSPKMTACGNGDFETGLDQTEWTGAWGSVQNLSNMTAGILSGPLTSTAAHQTWVQSGSGTDPTGIPLTAQGSHGAVRIGNSAPNLGAELLSKTFTVTAGLVKFWYAVVFEDPGHQASLQPFFWVRVRKGANTVPGLVDLGNGSDRLTSGPSSFFHTYISHPGATPVRFTDWSCAQINLSSLVGQIVTVEFITGDCGGGAHYGYAYVDNFCGSCAGSPGGDISFDARSSTTCGPGKLCFNYSLPTTIGAAGPVTGTITISLGIYQNGSLLTTLTSPTLTSGTSFCFDINPSTIAGINPALGGFDFVGRGVFTLPGATPAPMLVGTEPNGQGGGTNDDYKIACEWCCPGPNLVKNGNFDTGDSGFTSQYNFHSAVAVGATAPGSYNIVTSPNAAFISPAWVATDHYACKGGAGPGKFMVINGLTCQASSRIIWRETVSVKPGEYRFCAYAKNFKQCTFDILPKVEVKFSAPMQADNIPPTTVNTTAAACDWQLISGTLHVPAGTSSVTIELWLDETGMGDGNDLALDDISLQLKTALNHNYVLVNITTTMAGTNHYNVTATAVNLPAAYSSSYFWQVCEIDAAGNPLACVTNQPPWWTYPTCTFNGYLGSGTNLGTSTTVPGVFDIGRRYRITFGVWSDCERWDQSTWILQYNTTLKRAEVTSDTSSSQDEPSNAQKAADSTIGRGLPTPSGGCC